LTFGAVDKQVRTYYKDGSQDIRPPLAAACAVALAFADACDVTGLLFSSGTVAQIASQWRHTHSANATAYTAASGGRMSWLPSWKYDVVPQIRH